jgi:serine/threonine protein kinase
VARGKRQETLRLADLVNQIHGQESQCAALALTKSAYCGVFQGSPRGVVRVLLQDLSQLRLRRLTALRHGLSVGVEHVEQVLWDTSTGRQRALKLMLPQLVADPGLRARFEQEARIGSRIESEHVIEVVGAGIDRNLGAPWLAMELLRGEDLAALVRRSGALRAEAAIEIVEQLGHAVGAAHAAGIVHRDLKPENIFIAEAKQKGITNMVKVLDFGIAKVIAEAKTTQTAAVGSPMWMAPEQTARGGVIGPQTDVWSIGLIVYHLVAATAVDSGCQADDDCKSGRICRSGKCVRAPQP